MDNQPETCSEADLFRFDALFANVTVESKKIQEGLAVASIARDVVEMTPPRDDNAR